MPPRAVRTLILVLALVAAISLLWRVPAIREAIAPAALAHRLDAWSDSPWLPAAVVAAFVVGGLVMFPVTVLITVAALVLPPRIALLSSFAGVMISAALLYAIGARFRERVREMLGERAQLLESRLARRGVLKVAAIRMVPIAPFTVVNLAAGSLGVAFRDYVIGTAIGLLPGLVALSLFGTGIRQLFAE